MKLNWHSQRMWLWLIFIIIPTLTLQVVQSLFYNDSNSQVRHGSCGFRSVRQAEFLWDSREKSMTESFVLNDVEYKLCRYQVTWDEALVFCSNYKAHLATLDSEEKTAFIVQAIASISSVSDEYWIGARKMYKDPWKWNSNEMTLSSEVTDIVGGKISIWYPEFEPNNIHCLTIDRSGHNEAIFVPRVCNQRRGFICQRDNDRAFDNKIRMVAATRIDEKEFRLYAGRVTWPEAVVQCRQEGLQIARVNTVQQARILAMSMLRNRPEAMESVWIGGYTRKDDENTWRWLASGEKIKNNNGLWRKDVSESSGGGCLLLDRHVCQSPVYVESTCDRKRDVLCEKPWKKLVSKTPVPVVVDGCPYWVGFQPLKWSDARRACESLNASLVVLNSAATISHMMSLMLDNKAELRHIWTNGRRSSKMDGQWIWDVTGESIPDFGKSFIPWCPDDDYYRNENSCLNLDRENLDSPLVYGLSCREKQTYVCQPHTGDCVFHSTPNLPLDTVINSSEDIEKETTFEYPRTLDKYMTTFTTSTITTPFSIVNLNDDVIQTSFDSKNNDFDEFMKTWKASESDSGRNSSSQHNFAQYLKPFTRFTLPSLPHFGIKVVSAADEAATTNLSSIEMKMKKNKAYKLLATSSHTSAAAHLPPSSSFSTSITKGPSDARKIFKDQGKIDNLSNSHETTISSTSTESTIEKSLKFVNTSRPAFTQISPSLKSSLGSKNSSMSSKASKISTTSSSIVSDNSSGSHTSTVVGRTKKYSMKTTRDINLPKTPATTNAPEVPNVTDEQKITSKAMDSFVVKKPRPNSTLVTRRRPNFRMTTESSTPYDAIDMEYYNDDKNDKSTKKSVEGNAKATGESNEYSDDYEATSSAKLPTKKKLKHTSTLSLRKNLPPSTKSEEEEEEEEEESSNEEDEDAIKSSLPIAAELSKNLENALVTMMKNGLEKKNREKSGGLSSAIKTDMENAPWLREKSGNEGNGFRSTNAENISLRPYYSFEGPMIADLPEVTNNEQVQREFKFIGKKLTPEGFHVMKNIRPESIKEITTKSPNNETRRHINIQQQSNSQNHPSNFPISIMGMPPIHPNDPNSMMQLGRYFKNQFGGLQHITDRDAQDRRPQMTNPREEIAGNDQKRFRSGSGRPFLQETLGGYPVNREQDVRNKGRQWEKPKRPGLRESDGNYYAGGRRLYPRGNYDIYGSLAQQEGRNNEERLRNDREKKLDVTWPDEYVVNYDNFDQPSQPVSPRSSPVPIRTTRSFHEEIAVGNIEAMKKKPFPDFKLSKLVKEVKIDLDQRILRRYLEGFTKKIGRRNPGAKVDDWKDTWRQLLKQMLSLMDRMNINVNGDVMKLRVGSDDRNNKLSAISLENSRELNKERKDSASRNYANLVKKMNENLQKNSRLENRKKSMQASLNSLQIKDSSNINDKPQSKLETTDNYSYITIRDNRDSTTVNSLEEDKIKVTTFPGPHSNNDKFSKHRQERTDKPIVDNRKNSHEISNVLHPKYTNFNNTKQIVRNQESIIPMARLSTVFGYRPLMPQLHHRIIFQPGWAQIRAKTEPQKTVLKGEYLPKGRLSKILNSGNKEQHFEEEKNEAEKPDHNFLASESSTVQPEESNLEESPKNSFEKKTHPKSVNDRKMNEENHYFPAEISTVSDISENNSDVRNKSNKGDNQRDKVSGTNNNSNEAWREVAGEIGKNKLRNENLDGFYNATYVGESKDRKIDDDDDDDDDDDNNKEGSRRDMEEEMADKESHEDYNQKPIWTPAHRLRKAMELSVLRKFGANPLNTLRSKNLVRRSVKEIDVIRQVKTPETASGKRGYNHGQKIEQDLENLKEEPSVISLRMIMNPERKSSRIFRQSEDRRISEKNPPTVELRVQFSGKEQVTTTVNEKIYSRNHWTLNEKKKNKTLHSSGLSESRENVQNENSKSLVAVKRPIRFIVDKERSRAKINRLRDQTTTNIERNYLRAAAAAAAAAKRRENETATSHFRDRKYRNIGLGTKNALIDAKAVKNIPNVKHYMATSLRSFDEKNLTNSGESMWKKAAAKPYPKDMGVDWAEQASALFADLKESSDDLTLYIDLTLGRVGSKPRIRGRSKG